MLKNEWKEKGFVDEPIAEETDLKTEIRRLCKEKDAVILSVIRWHWLRRLQRLTLK